MEGLLSNVIGLYGVSRDVSLPRANSLHFRYALLQLYRDLRYPSLITRIRSLVRFAVVFVDIERCEVDCDGEIRRLEGWPTEQGGPTMQVGMLCTSPEIGTVETNVTVL